MALEATLMLFIRASRSRASAMASLYQCSVQPLMGSASTELSLKLNRMITSTGRCMNR